MQRVGDDGAGDAAAGGVGEHFRAEIGGDDLAVGALALDFQGEIAGAAGDVEQARGLPPADAPGDDLAPPDVHAAAQDVVGQDIAVRDPGEGIVDVGGIGHVGAWPGSAICQGAFTAISYA